MGNSRPSVWQPAQFGLMPEADDSRNPQGFNTVPAPASPDPPDNSFSSPFHEEKRGLAVASPFPNPFPQENSSSKQQAAQEKQRKSHAKMKTEVNPGLVPVQPSPAKKE
jgi:hypothetical protein